jgi:hypothetical protein
MGSYAAHASYMQVWTIAKARATTGGAARVLRIACSTAAFHRRTTSSLAFRGKPRPALTRAAVTPTAK